MPAVTFSGGFSTTTSNSLTAGTARPLSVTASAGDTIIVVSNAATAVTYDNGGTVSSVTSMYNGGLSSYGTVFIYKIVNVSGNGTVSVTYSTGAANIRIAAAVYQNVGTINGVTTTGTNSTSVSVTATNPTDGMVVGVFGSYASGTWTLSGTAPTATSRASLNGVTGANLLIADSGTAGSRTITASAGTTLYSGATIVLNPTASAVPTNRFFAMF